MAPPLPTSKVLAGLPRVGGGMQGEEHRLLRKGCGLLEHPNWAPAEQTRRLAEPWMGKAELIGGGPLHHLGSLCVSPPQELSLAFI